MSFEMCHTKRGDLKVSVIIFVCRVRILNAWFLWVNWHHMEIYVNILDTFFTVDKDIQGGNTLLPLHLSLYDEYKSLDPHRIWQTKCDDCQGQRCSSHRRWLSLFAIRPRVSSTRLIRDCDYIIFYVCAPTIIVLIIILLLLVCNEKSQRYRIFYKCRCLSYLLKTAVKKININKKNTTRTTVVTTHVLVHRWHDRTFTLNYGSQFLTNQRKIN